MIWRRLRERGVLGINARNACYTLRWNDRSRYPMVDDKLLTKRLCEESGIPVPKLLAVAHHHFQLRGFAKRLDAHESFVLKPVRGAMGNGIIVIAGRQGDDFVRSDGRILARDEFRYHAAGIISGLYSLAGHADRAMVEERLEVHADFARIATRGVPDVRVIVYRGVPVMAMTRLPTRASSGRANLHQGAVGAGIDLVTGRTTHAILRNVSVRANPDTGLSVLDVPIPYWERVLEIAVRATDHTELGYVGADVVVDKTRGPVVLELNARPGLAVQLANRFGLRLRLDAVDANAPAAGSSVEERVALGLAIAASERSAAA